MADLTVKRLDEFEGIFDGGMLRVRAGLGVTSFGMQVIQLPPNFTHYPEHSHSHDDQEEVYTALSGKASLQVGGTEHMLEPGVRILAIGGVPGRAYEPPEFTEEGGIDPPMTKHNGG